VFLNQFIKSRRAKDCAVFAESLSLIPLAKASETPFALKTAKYPFV
jgi:hypothetical protein